ncbi:MAG TPA: serine/threonine-protein kinase [Polyangiaceae bacterium]|nr:serine/threonine-protein kinase [Polyangiaceae bacterium]
MSAGDALARPLAPGSVIAGKYRVEGVLGTGGMGTVYRARHVGSGDAVALKLLHAHLVQNHQVSERFQREASILRRLRGRHLVALLDFGQDEGGRLFMALELVEGQALDRLVRERGPFAPDDAAQLVGGICDALASAHAHGVVHRDLTPANVMVERDELGRPHVRVFDFGLAKALHDASGAGSVALTQHNMIFGTAEYMSPEQVRGEELDGRSDVYAVGVILYELLTGLPPFRGQNDVITMTSHLTETPEAPSRRLGRPGVIGPQLDAVVLRAIAKNRDERFATAHALRDALFQALRPDRTSARPATPGAGSPALAPGGASPALAPGRPSAPPDRPRPPAPSYSGVDSDTMLAAKPVQAPTPAAVQAPPPAAAQAPAHAPAPVQAPVQAHAPAPVQAPVQAPAQASARAPVVVAPPPSQQGSVDPFTTTMTLQGPPPGPGPLSPRPEPSTRPAPSAKSSARPGPIDPKSLTPPSGFKPLIWVSVALLAILLGVALGVGLSMYRLGHRAAKRAPSRHVRHFGGDGAARRLARPAPRGLRPRAPTRGLGARRPRAGSPRAPA